MTGTAMAFTRSRTMADSNGGDSVASNRMSNHQHFTTAPATGRHHHSGNSDTRCLLCPDTHLCFTYNIVNRALRRTRHRRDRSISVGATALFGRASFKPLAGLQRYVLTYVERLGGCTNETDASLRLLLNI